MTKTMIFPCLILLLLPLISVAFAYTNPHFAAPEFALSFLRDVAGINVGNYETFSFDATSGIMPNSNHYQTLVRIVIDNQKNKFEILFTFIDGKFWTYDLYLVSGKLDDSEQTFNYSLLMAKRAIGSYTALFNVSHSAKFSSMVSTALNSQNLVLEDEDTVQRISCDESRPLETTNLQWFEKLSDGSTQSFRSMSISISKTGFVSQIVDNLMIYHVATTNVNVSREEAINLSMPYIETYARKCGQAVAETRVTFAFTRDSGSKRGDIFAIYPSWSVRAFFDKINDESVGGYGVLVWADNSVVDYHGPEGFYGVVESSRGKYVWWVFGIVLSILVFVVVGTYFRRSRRESKGGHR